MKPCLVLIDIWPLRNDEMTHLPEHITMRRNIATLVDLCTDKGVPTFLINSGLCLPTKPPELLTALRRSGNLLDDSALSPDGWTPGNRPMVTHLPNGNWPLGNVSLPDRHRVLIYAGYAADYSLGTQATWGYLRHYDKRQCYIIPECTLAMPTPDTISDRWSEWRATWSVGTPQARVEEFCYRYASDCVDIIRLDHVPTLLDDVLATKPPSVPLTLVCVPFPIQEGSADTSRLINSVESWIRLDPQPEIIFFCEDEKTACYLNTHYPNVRTTTDLALNKMGDLDLGHIFRTADALATNDLICYVDSDVILLPHTIDVLAYCAQRYDSGTYSLCAGRWSIPSGLSLDYDDPAWPDTVRSRIIRSHDVGSDFTIYPRGVLGDMPPFSIGKGWWDGWRMARLIQLGLHLVDIQDLQFALHQDHGHRYSGHPGTGYNVELCKASGLEYKWIRDVKEKVSKGEFETWLNSRS